MGRLRLVVTLSVMFLGRSRPVGALVNLPRAASERASFTTRLAAPTQDCDPNDDECLDGQGFTIEFVSRSFDIVDLILQRTIQTQLHYFAEFRNEPQASWLKSFRGHEHLNGGGYHSCF